MSYIIHNEDQKGDDEFKELQSKRFNQKENDEFWKNEESKISASERRFESIRAIYKAVSRKPSLHSVSDSADYEESFEALEEEIPEEI